MLIFFISACAVSEVQKIRNIAWTAQNKMNYKSMRPRQEWRRLPEIEENNFEGNCIDYMFLIGDSMLNAGISPEQFRYCILEKHTEVTERYRNGLRYHAVLLYYGLGEPKYIHTTGNVFKDTFTDPDYAYERTGYYPAVSFQQINGKTNIWRH